MRIFILGNINAGKSTFGLYVLNHLGCIDKSYKIISIDDFREKYGDFTLNGEIKAQNEFIKAIKRTENALIEMVGFGDLANEILQNLNKNSVIILYLHISLEICLQRIDSKLDKFKKIPYIESSDKLEHTITMIDTYLQNGTLESLWDKAALKIYKINASRLDSKEDIARIICDIPFCHYHFLFMLQEIFRKKGYKKLISYGSLARGSIDKSSDLDLILITESKITKILTLLKNTLKNYNAIIYELDRKIIININKNCKINIEMAVVTHFNKYVKYYHGSNITNISKSILLGNLSLQRNIHQSLDKFKNNLADNTDLYYHAKKISYYLRILIQMADRNDEFRFFFINNIILDSIMRFLCIKEGIMQYLYCPKNTNDIVKKYSFNTLIYDMKENTIESKKTHISKIELFCDKVHISKYFP